MYSWNPLEDVHRWGYCNIFGGGIAPQIQTRVPLMHKTAYPICKEFLGPLPKLMHHSLLHTARHECTFRAFFNGPKVWKLHGIHFILIAVCELTDGSQMPCSGRLSNIWNIMRTLCHTIFVSLDHKESPQIHVRQWHVVGCDSVP